MTLDEFCFVAFFRLSIVRKSSVLGVVSMYLQSKTYLKSEGARKSQKSHLNRSPGCKQEKEQNHVEPIRSFFSFSCSSLGKGFVILIWKSDSSQRFTPRVKNAGLESWIQLKKCWLECHSSPYMKLCCSQLRKTHTFVLRFEKLT